MSISPQLIRAYRAERKLGYSAQAAVYNAKTRLAWRAIEDDSDAPAELGAVRLRLVPDECADLSFLEQDIFADTRDSEYDRANNDGVWGMVGEYWTGETWEHADSVWGFIGDDWRNSGYDVDVMRNTLDASRNLHMCPLCGHVRHSGTSH